MKLKLFILFAVIFVFAFTSVGDREKKYYYKIFADDDSKFTNVGNIALTVTNFGTYGHGFSKWPEQPSCEYPIGSGIEHIFDGGLWVGGFLSDDSLGSNRLGPYVSTGAVDASSVSNRGGGFEYTNKREDVIKERSSLLESKSFSPDAVSHQDFFMEYVDTNTAIGSEPIVDHDPLGIAVRHETYAWNFPFADFFVIMNYWIKNVGDKYIDSVYVGLWTDSVVRNTNITGRPSGGDFYNKGGNGYNDSLNMAYEFDATGDVGFTDSYIGIQFLGSDTDFESVNFVSWQFRNTDDPRFFAPTIDVERYQKMRGFFGSNSRYGDGVTASDLKSPSNRSMLITMGDVNSIAPGDSINVTFAIVAAKKTGIDLPSLDTEEQKSELYTHGAWALRAYNGEDRNGDGIIDPDEDLDGDGKITRYILPAPPKLPKTKVIPENQRVTVYWDKSSEKSIDPISGKKDFEGYRLYRTNPGYELGGSIDLISSLVKIAEFDSMGNDIGFNTGFSQVEMIEPVTFPGDTTKYYYKFEIEDLLNGWQYTYTVTSFDEGDPGNNLSSLESSLLGNSTRIIPGTLPTSDANVKIGVYPNPYYGGAYWDGSSERLRKIYFYNLPEECEITVYTLSGDIVKNIYHNQISNGSDIRWFENYARDASQKMAGGEHAWDLITNDNQAIATGLYLFSVKDIANGNIKTGKFLVIK
ncbi:MAG: hypothetical protein K9J16_10240 [Melioribacteraceae bacterium]|nr:hypothetical protein [Melioribacteraceae bacterium]MCF8353392.1 hypothetical protein [Melioribacteraceae bacterium]MCF8393029.1 hypothetical protein [Melioribacteraceae bacterium]MCF8419118.1 hypothetical protein [Melioribacteraceae bacterium]